MCFFDGLAAGVGAFEVLIDCLVAIGSVVPRDMGATSSYTSYQDTHIRKWVM